MDPATKRLFYPRGKGKILWTWLDGKRVSTGKRDLKAAALWRAGEERRRADPAYAAEETTSLLDAVKAFNAELVTAKRSDATRIYYSGKVGHLLRVLGDDTFLARLTAERMQAYVTERIADGGSSLRNIAKELATLHGVLGLARHLGWFTRDPKSIMPRKLDAGYVPRKRFLSHAEFLAVLERLAPHRASWVAFVVATGARMGEANRARRRDVDLNAGTVVIRGTKTRSNRANPERKIPILDFARPLLERALRDGKGEGAMLLMPWASSNASRDLQEACALAKIPHATPTDLRRTHASWLVQAGAPTHLVAYMLGHTSSAMVERVYGRMTPEAAGKLLALVSVQKRHNAEIVEASKSTKRPKFPGRDSNPDSENQKPYRGLRQLNVAGILRGAPGPIVAELAEGRYRIGTVPGVARGRDPKTLDELLSPALHPSRAVGGRGA